VTSGVSHRGLDAVMTSWALLATAANAMGR
jgi:hypothetical protein